MGPLDDKTTPLRANLLLVDDQPAGLREVADLLAELDQNLVQALSTDEAFQRLREEEFAVVLLHVPMRGVDAFETARQIRSGEKSLATPIIFLADQESPELPPARAYTLGAVDFLMKPLVPEILRAKVAGLVDLFHKTKHCAGQADRLRRLERQEHERRLTEELARQNEEERARLLAQAEQARAEAEQQRDFARLILEQTPIAVSVSEGPEHRLVLVNRAAAGLFGLPPEDFLGRTPADWGYEASEKVVPLLDQVYHSGKTAVLPELTISLPRKGTLCLHMTYVPLLGAGGRPMGVLHLGLDLTKRKKVEEERKKLLHQLEAERALLEAVLQQMPGGVLIAEAPSGKVLLRNQSGAIPAILAAPLPASLEDYARFQQTFPDPRYASYRQWPLLRALLQGEVVAEEEMAYRNPDGTRGTLRANAAPIRDREGRIVAAVTTFFDVTERKRAEEALRFLDEASKVLASSLDYSTTLVSVAHLVVPRLADWCTVHIVEEDGSTRQLAVAHADPARAAWARELEQRYPPDPNGPSGVQEVLRTGRPTLVEDIPQEMVDAGARDAEHREILRGLGLRSCMIVPLSARGRTLGAITFLTAESGRRYGPADLALAEELAQRAALAVDNARLYHESQEAERRKDQLLAMLAHELRNPLAPVRNALHILQRVGGHGAAAEQARAVMDRQVRHLTLLIEDLLDVSRIKRNKIRLRRERLDLVSVMRTAAEAYRGTLEGKGLTLTLELPARALWVDADPTRLSQVLDNLLSNASKFTDRGGRIMVRVAPAEKQRAAVTVEDTGVGLDPQLLPRIWETFAQAEQSLDRSQGGLGLGLALVKGLVQLHGGEVRAASAGPGRGAAFTFLIPLQGEGPAPAADTSSPGAIPPGQLRILIIEDNLDSALSLRMLLELFGHQVRAAHSGEGGVEAAQQDPPDVVLCDIGLPGMSGYQVAETLRRHPATARMPMVALSGYGQPEDRERSRQAGFDAHLVKPVEVEELQRYLGKWSQAVSRPSAQSMGEHTGRAT